MQLNPLAVVFLVVAVAFFGLTLLIVWMQKRMLRDQAREVQQLLAEVRDMSAQEGAAARSERSGPADTGG